MSAYKEPAYKELPAIRNWLWFPNLYYGYVYKELRLLGIDFDSPIFTKDTFIRNSGYKEHTLIPQSLLRIRL